MGLGHNCPLVAIIIAHVPFSMSWDKGGAEASLAIT